jgi:hypothetical protein
MKMLDLIRKITRLTVPLYLRSKMRVLIFKKFRKIGILYFFRSLGFITCKNYLQIPSLNKEYFLNKNKEFTKQYEQIEENEIKKADYIEGEGLDVLKPFVAKTYTVILEISNGGFSFRNNHLLDKDLNVIGEFRSEESQKIRTLPIYSKVLEKPNKLHGTVAYLSDPAPANYYHWMCRTLPLLNIYHKFFDFNKIDFFYIGKFQVTSFHQESLTKAGIAMNQIIQEGCIGDKMLIAITNRTCRGFGDPINREAFMFTRNLFIQGLNKPQNHRRIYIQRGKVIGRNVINETQVIELLNSYGFESVTMDDKTIQEQAELFSQSVAIVAAHGAALTNLLFIQPGVKVIELMPYGYVNDCFYVLASHGEANYFCLQGNNINQRDHDTRKLDIYVDVQKLDKICRMAGLDKI